MLQGFKDFISRGNVIDLAVGVIIGAAFSNIVKALVDGVLNPLLAGIFGQPNFQDLGSFSIGQATVMPGLLINAVIQFLLVAAGLYFMIVLPMNKLAVLREKKAQVEADKTPELTIEEKLLTEIRDLLSQK